jgi:hypothetical protein
VGDHGTGQQVTARTGRTLGRTIYRNGDVYLGVADTVDIATIAVNALNGVGCAADLGIHPGPWFAAGRMVYAPPAIDVLTDWIIAMDTPELATEVANAVNTVSGWSVV